MEHLDWYKPVFTTGSHIPVQIINQRICHRVMLKSIIETIEMNRREIQDLGCQNSIAPTDQEAENIKRGGKNTHKNCTKNDLHDPDNHNGVIIT